MTMLARPDETVDPLERLSKFVAPAAEPVSLPVVSVVFETRPYMLDRVRRIAEWHRRWFKFHREVIVSDKDPGIPGMLFVCCGQPPTGPKWFEAWYSDMCIRWMRQLCDGRSVMVWQWDGFILNPGMWSSEFLEWDYVGVPTVSDWFRQAEMYGKRNEKWVNPLKGARAHVGNGGFSLRSRKLMEATASLKTPDWSSAGSSMVKYEDMYICIEKRAELEGMGVRFSPLDVASRFARGDIDKRKLDGCFGFHGPDALPEAKLLLESRYLPK